jgi:hypothetical protein
VARRVQLQIANNASATTPGVDWPGGKGLLMVSATFGGGTVALEQQSPTGVWLPLTLRNSTTAISLTANGTVLFEAPAGPIRLAITTATAVFGHAIGIPVNG